MKWIIIPLKPIKPRCVARSEGRLLILNFDSKDILQMLNEFYASANGCSHSFAKGCSVLITAVVSPRPHDRERHGVDVRLAVRLRVAVGVVVALWPGVLLTVQALRAFSGGFLGAGAAGTVGTALRWTGPFLDVVGEEVLTKAFRKMNE